MTDLDYWIKLIQQYADKVAGLKIQNRILKQENVKLENENRELRHQIKGQGREYDKLRKAYNNVLKRYEVKE